jgi:hypothetical protein
VALEKGQSRKAVIRVDQWRDWVQDDRRGHARYASSMPGPLTR